MNKNKIIARKDAILELIKKFPIENQDQLVQLLQEQYGIETNQSIVSRDLRELDITKRKFKNSMIYEQHDIDVYKEIMRLGIKDIAHNESLIIIKTLPGLAAFVGDYLDSQNEVEFLATLAGENVVFVVPISTKDVKKNFLNLCQLVHFKSSEIE